jgi:NAD-dependent DNA ligase
MPNPTIVCNGKTVELLREIILEPTSCPFCGGKISRHVTKKGTGAVTYCDNLDCPKKRPLWLSSWKSRMPPISII